LTTGELGGDRFGDREDDAALPLAPLGRSLIFSAAVQSNAPGALPIVRFTGQYAAASGGYDPPK